MAKQVQPLEIILGIKGAEKLAALKSSFRDLTKTVGQTDAGIEAARKSINDYARSANNSEAVIRGQIKVFEGLREQAAMGGKVYRELANDITELKAQLNGSTSAIDAQRKSLLETAGSAKVTQSQLLSVANALSTLQKQTALGSKAFVELGQDIANLEGKIAKVKTEQEELNKLNLAANQAATGSAAATRLQIKAIDQKIASLREEKRAAEELSRQSKIRLGMQGLLDRPGDVPFRSREYIEQAVAESLLGENITKMFGAKELQTAIDFVKQSVAELQNQVEVELGSSARRAFQEMARQGRESARSLAIAFSGPEFERIFANLEKNVGKLPNTTTGLSQRLRELERVFNNTARGGDNYVAVALEIARVQREASAATQGLGAALVDDLASGVAVRSQRNLREAIGQLQAEMAELNTTTAEGSAKYAQNAAQVSRLQKELDGIANSYRNVSDAARQAGMATGGASLNPFTASGARSAAFMREKEKQEMEQISQLQQELNELEGEYVDSIRSALQTIQEYQQKRHDDFMRQVDERITAEQKASQEAIENTRREGQALDDQFNVMLQQRKAAASAMGIGGREDISSLYQSIIGLSTADIRRQQEMMGKSATEVFNDIATAFQKSGRAVDLKQRTTAIGDSIAEGVVDGASESNEINKGAKAFAQRLIAAYKAAFGIRSPSKETEQKIGLPLGLGIIKGLLRGLRQGKREVQQEIQSIAETPLVPRSREPRRLIGTVNEEIATFTGYGTRPRPATPGYRPLQSNIRLDSEIERMFNQFRVNIAAVTTDAEIYYNLLQSLPTSRITTDLAAIASRRARAAEIPGFIQTQRQIGLGDLERAIASSVAGYMKELRTPNPWVGPIGDYRKFIDSVSQKTEELIRLREYLERFTLSDQKLLTGTRIAGALPPSRIGFAAEEGRLARILGLGTTKALPPARRRFGELQRPDIGMFEPEGTAKEYRKMARLLAEASSDFAAAKRFIDDVGFQNLPVDVTGLSGTALTNALMGYSRQKRGMSGAGYPDPRGIFPGANTSFRGGVAPGKFSFGGQEALPPSKPQLALPSAEMREFFRDVEFEFRKLRAKVRGGSEGEHFMEPGRGGGRYQAGFLGGGGGGGGRRSAAGGAGGEFDKLNQVLRDFGPLSDRSVNDIRELGASLNSLQDIISPLDADFEQVNKAIAKQSRLIDRELQKRERQRSRRRMSSMQMTQAAGAAISGGIFGGPEGFLGGVGGALVGGVGGAFAGAAFGAQVGGFRRQVGQYTEMAAEIDRLRLGLAGASNDFADFVKATQATEQASQRLLIPLADSYRIMTQLRANTVELGISTDDTRKIFEGITASIYKTGGGLAEVQGAMRAVIQVLSKGSPQAEELRGQLGERLPAAIVDFAKFTKRTPGELADAFKQSKVTLQEFVDFTKNKFDENGEYLDELASNAAYAGLRYSKALERIQLTTGRAFQASGAALQDFASRWINKIDQIVNKAMELRLIDVGPAYFMQQLLSGERTVDQLETELLEKSAKLAEMRKTFFVDAAFVAMGGDRLQSEVNALEQALKQQRAFERQTKEREKQTEQGREEREKRAEQDRIDQQKEQRATSLLNAIEQRENAIAQARIQLEEQAANIRKQAIEQAKQLEQRFADQRLQKERQLQDLRRQLAYVEEDIALSVAESQFIAGGGDPEIARIRREAVEFERKQKEEGIELERQFLDEQTETSKAIEEFKSSNAEAIMEANEQHTKRMGEIQREYARNVAKIIEEGTGRAGERLELAGVIIANEIKKAEAQATALSLGYLFRRGGVPVGPSYDVLSDDERSALGAASEAFIDAEKAIDRAANSLVSIPTATAIVAPAIDKISMNFDNFTGSLEKNAAALDKQNEKIKKLKQGFTGSEEVSRLVSAAANISAGLAGKRQQLERDQAISRGALRLREEGYSDETARSLMEQELDAAQRLARIQALRQEAESAAGSQEELARVGAAFDTIKQNIESSANAVRDLTIALDNIPTEIKLRMAVVDLQQQLRDLVDPASQIKGAATAIGDAFSQSFVDAISGAKTAKEALADFFQSVGSYFLDMAKQIIAKMIQIAILNSVARLLPGLGFTGSSAFNLGGMGQAFAPGGSMPFPMLANGGPVNANEPYIVGERGPELFIPSQRGQVMSNKDTQQLMGQTQAASLPFTRNAEPTSAMEINSEIKVKYESTVINGVEYVTAEQHRKGMAQAAERGRALTLQALQNSPRTRRRVGI